MRQITTAVLMLVASASFAYAKPAPSPHGAGYTHPHATVKTTAKKMTPQECSAACTKAMHAKGMAGSCPASMCMTSACPMHKNVAMKPAKAAKKPAKKKV